MTFPRLTLAGPVAFEGRGLHTGEPVRMTVHPGEAGIAFRLGSERTLARPENVTDTTRSTKVGSVGTVEHVMSALCGLQITDAEIELDAPEVPGMDGSALPYVEAFGAVGFTSLGDFEVPGLFRRLFLQEGDVKIAVGKGAGHWRYAYDTGARWPHTQAYEAADVVAGYATEIAPCRTFALSEEIPQLIQLGLGRGLDDTSALVLGPEGYKNAARFPDEPARHKLLDLMGDLYLAGVPARALSVVAERSGHRANVRAAAQLRQALAS